MSTLVPWTVTCAACGLSQEAEVADSVHVSGRPDLRDAILEGSFHRFMCARCGVFTTIERVLAYTDFDRWHWFVVVPRDEVRAAPHWVDFERSAFDATMVTGCPPWVASEWGPRMIRRVVFGLASLREKLIAFDQGIDDRVLEILKWDIHMSYGLPLEVERELVLVGIEPDAWTFAYRGGAASRGAEGTLVVSPNRYVELAAADDLRARWPELFTSSVVDQRAMLAGLERAASDRAAAREAS